jgi:hypothetical protein
LRSSGRTQTVVQEPRRVLLPAHVALLDLLHQLEEERGDIRSVQSEIALGQLLVHEGNDALEAGLGAR